MSQSNGAIVKVHDDATKETGREVLANMKQNVETQIRLDQLGHHAHVSTQKPAWLQSLDNEF